MCFVPLIFCCNQSIHSNWVLVLGAPLLVNGMVPFILCSTSCSHWDDVCPLSSFYFYFFYPLRIPEIFLYVMKSIILDHTFQRTVLFVTWAAILTNRLRESLAVCEQLPLVPLSSAAYTHNVFFFY